MTTDQHSDPKSDIEIAQAAAMRPVVEVGADRLGIPTEMLDPYGHYKAKVALDHVASLDGNDNGRLILVTAITPTPAGEGKTTTTIGLGDALNRNGKKTMVCLREPSLGPCFGIKGGAAGGGYSQVVPMEDINLHFTGDLHAIGTANNLLAAAIDNHLYWGNAQGIDARRIAWRRVVDMNDRALRHLTVGLGGVANGFPREDGFDITAASEVMAIFCLAENLDDLDRRLGRIVIGYTHERKPVTARDLEVAGAMTVLLKDALKPNLVQTLENNPVFIHGGPFANIAHGCNSVLATKTALKLADYVVTEAGFGADLGAEKFLDIKCRKTGLKPDCAVLVATVRALKVHGGVAKDDLGAENLEAVRAGAANWVCHIENLRSFGVPVVVAVNHFTADTPAEHALIKQIAAEHDVDVVICDHWARGGAGAEELAETVIAAIAGGGDDFRLLYPDDMPLIDKVRTIAQKIYRASDIEADRKIRDRFAELEGLGAASYPICMAKTQYSFSTDPALKGAPEGHVVPIRDVRLAGGAEFVIVICGDMMTMPGLPRVPAANAIHVDKDGQIAGLF